MCKNLFLGIILLVVGLSFFGCEVLDSIIIPDDDDVIPGVEITIEKNGEGDVTISPEEYSIGDIVTITAVETEEWVFMNWGGAADGNRYQVELEVAEDLVVEANFIRIEGENRVNNALFEWTEDGELANWAPTESGSDGTTLEQVTYETFVGDYAAKLSNRSNTWNRLRQRQTRSIQDGEWYFISFWIKHGQGEASTNARIDGNTVVAGETNDQEWTRISGLSQVSTEATWPALEIRVDSTEDYYVDNVFIGKVHADSLP